MRPAADFSRTLGRRRALGAVLLLLDFARGRTWTRIGYGLLLEGIAPICLAIGICGFFLPVLLFGLEAPHFPTGLSCVLTAFELPAGLLVAMITRGGKAEPLPQRSRSRAHQFPVSVHNS